MNRKLFGATLLGALLFATFGAAQVATYPLLGGYGAIEPGAPALVPFTPAQQSFLTDTVTVGSYTGSRTVLDRGGSGANQTGLELATTALLSNPNTYTVELVMSFANQGGYKRVVNSNDASDNGFYVLGDRLNLYPVVNGLTPILLGTSNYHHVVLSTDGTVVRAYLDGVLELSPTTGVMQNPNNLLRLFIDNQSGGPGGEYAPGRVALVRLYNSVLTDGQVATLAQNPFVGVPEPAGVVILALAATLAGCRLRNRS